MNHITCYLFVINLAMQLFLRKITYTVSKFSILYIGLISLDITNTLVNIFILFFLTSNMFLFFSFYDTEVLGELCDVKNLLMGDFILWLFAEDPNFPSERDA